MSTRRIGALLLILLLLAMGIAPMVSAIGQTNDHLSSDFVQLNEVRHHEIPYNYMENSKPAQFLPESKMMNIIISQDTLKKFGQDEKSALIEIPISHLYVNTGYTKKTGSINYYVENGVDSREGIVLLRMPTQIYDKLLEEFNGETLSLPTAYFYRFYANFDD